LANAFVRWNALECARGGHKSGHKLSRGRISEWATCWKQWWAGTGLNRRHPDFQSYSLGRGSARKCLLSKDGVTTASCAGVLRNDQECAGVGHSLDTTHIRIYWIISSARASTEGGIVRPSALTVLRLMTSSNLVGCSMGRSVGLAPLRMRTTNTAA